MLRSRFLLIVVLVWGLLSLACDQNTGPFTGGVAVLAQESPAESPGVLIGIPMVPDTGTASGGDHFAGITDGNGYDEHPFAHTNVNWTVVVSWSVVILSCEDNTITGYI